MYRRGEGGQDSPEVTQRFPRVLRAAWSFYLVEVQPVSTSFCKRSNEKKACGLRDQDPSAFVLASERKYY